MIVRQRVIWIETEDAFIFGDGFIEAAKFQVSAGQTILVRINAPGERLAFERLFEMLDSLFGPSLFESYLAEPVVVYS